MSTASAVNFSTKGTRSGYVSASWQTNETKSTVEAAIYNPVTEKWGSATALEADEAALFTWNDPAGRVQAAVFGGTAWTATELGPVAGGTSSTVGLTRSLATWLYQKNAYGALYDANAGWGDPLKLGATTAQDFGPGAAVDAAGNAFAAWPNGSSIAWRRQPNASSEWLDLQEIKDQDPGVVYANVDAAGNVMLVWSNPLGVWASRFE